MAAHPLGTLAAAFSYIEGCASTWGATSLSAARGQFKYPAPSCVVGFKESGGLTYGDNINSSENNIFLCVYIEPNSREKTGALPMVAAKTVQGGAVFKDDTTAMKIT